MSPIIRKKGRERRPLHKVPFAVSLTVLPIRSRCTYGGTRVSPKKKLRKRPIIVNKGISNFMHKLGTSYPNYFNKKYKRSGALFQGAYKIIHIDNNNYLLWLLGYVNGNIEIHGLDNAENYSWSSYQAIKKLLGNFDREKLSELSVLSGLEEIVLPQFKSENEFKSFVEEVIKESRTKKEMQKYILE